MMMKVTEKKKVSIIIPVYNAEKYLSRCIESIVDQDYTDLQIIVVDDGSTDNGLEVVQDFKDDRLQVFSIANGGVSNARNFGLSKATGYYVMFVDADDWLNPNVIGTLISAEQHYGYDLILGNYSRDIEYSKSKQVSTISFKDLTKDGAYRQVINPYGFYGSVWAKMFKLDIIKDNNLKFNNNITVGEDLLFVYQYLNFVKTVAYTDARLYNYYINKKSVLHSLDTDTLYHRLDILKVYETMFQQENIQKQSYYTRAVAIYVRELTDWYCYAVHFKQKKLSASLKEKIKKYWAIFMKDDTFSAKNKLAAFLKYHFPVLVYKLKG